MHNLKQLVIKSSCQGLQGHLDTAGSPVHQESAIQDNVEVLYPQDLSIYHCLLHINTLGLLD